MRSSTGYNAWPLAWIAALCCILAAWALQVWRAPAARVAPSGPRAESPAATGPPQRPVESPPHIASPGDQLEPSRELATFSAPRSAATPAPPAASMVTIESLGRPPQLPSAELFRHQHLPLEIDTPPKIDLADPAVDSDAAGDWLGQLERDDRHGHNPSQWPYPKELAAGLMELSQYPSLESWSHDILDQLQQLRDRDAFAGETPTSPLPTSAILDSLADLARTTEQIASAAPSAELQSRTLRVGYALERRLAIWQPLHTLLNPIGPADQPLPGVGDGEIAALIAAVERRIAAAAERNAWRQYLLLDELSATVQPNSTATTDRRQTLARRFLLRVEQPLLTSAQGQVLRQQPFSDLASALRSWATEPIDFRAMVQSLEDYESQQSTLQAVYLARCCQLLRWSHDDDVAELGQQLDMHYRNANLRLAVHERFVNRLLPQGDERLRPVRDRLLGAMIRGTSRAETDLAVKLIPATNGWHLDLEATGDITSDTRASRGPATFVNSANGQFAASKRVSIDAAGVRAAPARATSQAFTRLHGMRTTYDRIPLVGAFVRSVAKDNYDQQAGLARRHTEQRIAREAESQLDREVATQLEKLQAQFAELLQPFHQLHLNPKPIEFRTTEQRLVTRYRLAGQHQMGAHRPRPRAPSDSWLSAQIHQSALNNTLSQLQFEGRTLSLGELFKEVVDAFGSPKDEPQIPEDIPQDVRVTFANSDCLSVQCENGRVMLVIRIAVLDAGRQRQWRNLVVRALYRPDALQMDANLQRDEYVRIKGDRLKLRDQIALRGIFAKVLSRSRKFRLINRALSDDPRLHDLQVTQLVIRDGWIGLAVGPRRPGRVALFERYDPNLVR